MYNSIKDFQKIPSTKLRKLRTALILVSVKSFVRIGKGSLCPEV